ncbi:hypothetical protein BpHYR1_038861 [Brachionus plicatilis]|uniref:Uncharacterized protein n=1 Tax=Brachionus plicatilis TaxID=10195 RepID=A0A3M7RQE2_BRAPC|nr:hypothetical protein BpHYR1_038861 [Brachionus plicatilis]
MNRYKIIFLKTNGIEESETEADDGDDELAQLLLAQTSILPSPYMLLLTQDLADQSPTNSSFSLDRTAEKHISYQNI